MPINGSSTTTDNSSNGWFYNGNATYGNEYITTRVEVDNKCGMGDINPVLYFKYVKSKFRLLERFKLEKQLKELEKAFDQAVENGQNALAQKFLDVVSRETKEACIVAKGIKYCVEKNFVDKYKNQIKGGHISNTKYEDYTRVIPQNVIDRVKEICGLFDELWIYHYWNEEAQKDAKHMTPDEKTKMRDPILFGAVKESSKLYFIADWTDEYCDLTFDKLISFMGKGKKETEIPKPSLRMVNNE